MMAQTSELSDADFIVGNAMILKLTEQVQNGTQEDFALAEQTIWRWVALGFGNLLQKFDDVARREKESRKGKPSIDTMKEDAPVESITKTPDPRRIEGAAGDYSRSSAGAQGETDVQGQIGMARTSLPTCSADCDR